MMLFPIDELMDEHRCYDYLLEVLHPEGLSCPSFTPDQAPHDRHREPIFDYKCRVCGAVFNVFTDTIWSRCATIVLIIRGIVQGIPTKQWARDDDGDGIREVHCNNEGIWTGLRNFLRPFRGVHKNYLCLYVAMFEWAHNLKRITSDFLRSLMVPSFTFKPT